MHGFHKDAVAVVVIDYQHTIVAGTGSNNKPCQFDPNALGRKQGSKTAAKVARGKTLSDMDAGL